MILLADSGSTKTDWALARNGSLVKQITTEGINPFFQTEEEISRIVHERLMPALDGAMPHEVHFYGAGCAFPEKNRLVEQAITRHLPVPVEIGSDLLGAARSLCGRRPGIACIMGTGSNSCYYDGQTIAANVSPLGYVLGDEGSGAVLGRLLVGDCLKNQLPAPLKEAFFRRFDLTPQLILEQVYKQPFPNRFLASLSPFLIEHIDEPCIHRLVLNSFKSFFTRNVMQYDCRGVKVHFTGSIAYYYREVLDEAARALQIELGHIVRSPLEGLVTYHSNL
ncbi:ATPase [Barnesiella viscericola]|uniref:ATPase n=1 Tax=Barnesiella viscericola TaxID=397865 RepID=UPI0024B8322F|nr:ATPase [Barnesiella viscericola]